MPIIRSAKKRMRQNERRRMRNRAHRSRMRTAIKSLRSAIDAGDASAARDQWIRAQAIIDHTTRLGIIHPNTAARTKSRLARRVQQLA